MLACMLSRFSHVRLFATLRTPPGSSVHGIPRKGYWSGLPCPPPGDLPNPGIKPTSLMSPALAGGFFTTSATQEALAEVRDAYVYAGNSFTNTEKAAAVILGLYYEPKTFHEGLSQTMPDPSF